MIAFSCPGCGKQFNVKDDFAGKKARCKKCDAEIIVPMLPGSGGAANASAVSEVALGLNLVSPTQTSGSPAQTSVSGAGPAQTSFSSASAQTSASSAAPAQTSPAQSDPVPSPAAGQPARKPLFARTPVFRPKPAETAKPADAAPTAADPSKLPVRTRRLLADYAQIKQAFTSHPAIHLKETTGDPPDTYKFEFTLRSIEKMQKQQPTYRDTHLVEIQLTADYPRLSPQCKMLTPIFHPNIDPAYICVGDHWVAGERLTDLVTRIGEMIAYQAYNIKSPLNGEAAMWADLNGAQLPVDKTNLHAATEVKTPTTTEKISAVENAK